MNRTIDFINAKMNKQNAPVPQFLYKYRPFDGFALDMLEKGYMYLCPAEKLDDPSECTADFSVQDFYHLETGLIKFKCIEMILEQIKPYTTEENLQRVRNIVFRVATPSGMVRRNFLLDASCEIQDLVPEVDTAPLINFLGSIPEKFDDPKIKEQLEKLLALAYHARQGMGICSLSALKKKTKCGRTTPMMKKVIVSSMICGDMKMSTCSFLLCIRITEKRILLRTWSPRLSDK